MYTHSITLDTTNPNVAITVPANSSFKNALNSVTGTSADATSGVADVIVKLRKAGDSNGYWNGSDFTSDSSGATVFMATNTGTAFSTWSADTSSVDFADGDSYDVIAIATDNATNTGSATNTFTFDTSGPTGSLDINSGDPYTNTTSVTLNLDATDSSGIVSYRVANGSDCSAATFVTPFAGVDPYSADVPHTLTSSDGSKTVCVQYKDAAGNVSTTYTHSITLDETDPSVAITVPADGSFRSSLNSVTGTSSDATSGVAAVTVKIRKAGDTNGYWNGTGFTADSSGATVFTASNTGTAFSTWSADTSTVTFADGSSYDVIATATDNATNTGTVANTFTFDTTNPTGSLDINSGATYTKTTSVTLNLNASDASGIVSYRVANGSDCSSASFVTPFAPVDPYSADISHTLASGDGSKTVCVQYKDQAGNVSTTYTHSITLDETNPSVAITVPVDGSFRSSLNTVTGTSSDATSGVASVSVKVRLTGDSNGYWNGTDFTSNAAGATAFAAVNTGTAFSTWSADTSSVDFADGDSYDVIATATDNATNTGADVNTFTFDTTNPAGSLNINSGATYTKTTSVTLNLNASDASGIVSYRVANGSDCSSASFVTPFTPTDPYSADISHTLASGDGSKTVCVQYKDQAGNVSSTYTHSITLDETNPSVAITVPVDGSFRSALNTVTGTSSDATSGVASVSVKVRLAGDSNGYWNGTDFTANAAGATAFAASNTGTAFSTWSADTSTITFADGSSYDVIATATDNATNTGSATNTFTFDTTNPTGSLNINSGATYTKTTSVTLNLNASDSGGIVSYRVANGSDCSSASFVTPFAPVDPYSADISHTLPSGDGSKTVCVQYKDQAGNASSTYTHSITLDQTNPSVAITIPADGSFRNSLGAVTGTSSDATSGVASVTVKIRKAGDTNGYWNGTDFTSTSAGATAFTATNTGTAFSTWSADTSSVDFADGDSYDVIATATDNATNTGTVANTFTFDTTNPTGSLDINSGATYTKTTSVTLNLNASDASGIVSYRVANGSDCSSASFVTPFAPVDPYSADISHTLASGDGSKTVCVQYKDQAGNVSTTYTHSITLDETNPSVAITVPVDGSFRSSPNTVTGTSSDATSGVASVSVKVRLTGDSNGYWNGTDFTSNAAGATAFAAVNTGTAFSTWSADTSSVDFADGDSYDVIATATDNATNTGTVANTFTFDTTNPTGSLDINSGATYTKTTSVTLNLNASDASGIVSYRVANGSDCSSASFVTPFAPVDPYSADISHTLASGDGSKTVCVQYKDQAGNVSSTYTHSITLDETNPSVAITVPVDGSFRSSLNTVTGTSSDATSGVASVSVKVRLAGDSNGYWNGTDFTSNVAGATAFAATNTGTAFSTWSADTSTVTFADGSSYDVIATATDNATNTGSATNTFSFDTTNPTGSLDINSGATYTKTTSVTLNLNASDASGIVSYRVANGSDCSSASFVTPFAPTDPYSADIAHTLPSGDGSKTVCVQYKDSAGNVSSTYTHSITLDETNPTVAITVPVDGSFRSSLGAVTGSSSDATSGVASVTVKVREAGNANGYWNGTDFTANSAGATLFTATTSDSFAHWSADTSTVTFADGSSYDVIATATDNATNTGSATNTFSFDTTNPTGSLDINSGATYTKTTSVTLNLNASDASGIVSYRVANGSDCSSASFVTPFAPTDPYSADIAHTLPSGDGSKTVCVQYKDQAGNVSSTYTHSITLDETNPTVAITVPVDGSFRSSLAAVTGTSSDATSGVASVSVKVRLAGDSNGYWNGTDFTSNAAGATAFTATNTGTAFSTWSADTSSVDFADGSAYDVIATATDNATNTGSATKTFTFDTSDPTGSLSINNGAQYTNQTSVTLNLNASDASGIVSYRVANGSDCSGATFVTPFAPADPFSDDIAHTLPSGDGSKTVCVQYKDSAGNVSTTSTHSITLDQTNPSVAITVPGDGSFKNAVSAVSGTSSDATSGVASVTVKIRKAGDSNGYWNGTDFTSNSAGATVFTATDTGTSFSTWSADTSTVTFADGDSYDVIATASDNATNTGSATNTFNFDTTNPTGSLDINSGATYTTTTSVTLNLNASDASGIVSYRVANGSDCSSASFVTPFAPTDPYSADISHTLASGDGSKTVCVQYKDQAGNVSSTYTHSITLDTTNPSVAITIPVDGSLRSSLNAVTGTSSDATSGVSGVAVKVRLTGDSNGYWNGTDFTSNSAGATVFTATDTGTAFSTWSADTSTVTFADGSSYDVIATATDNATNTGSDTNTFTFSTTDGQGTMGVTPTSVTAGSSDNTLTFTYTAGTVGMSGGAVAVTIPAGWTAPQTSSSTAAGYTTASGGTGTNSISYDSGGRLLTVDDVTLGNGGTLTITYGDNAGGGGGATATTAAGDQEWTTSQKTMSGGTLVPLASSPTITVTPAALDHITIDPTDSTISAGGSETYTSNAYDGYGNLIGDVTAFTTYTIAPDGGCVANVCGADTSGDHTVTADYSGKQAQATLHVDSDSVDHFTVEAVGGGNVGAQQRGVGFNVDIIARDSFGNVATGFAGTVDVNSNRTISGGQPFTSDLFTNGEVTQAITLTDGGTASNITVQNSFGPQTGASNDFTVYSADGDGTISSNTAFVRNGSTGNTITLTYTAAAGGISDGTITVDVPTGWSQPSTNGSDDGFTKTSAGSVSTSGQTITVSGISPAEGGTVQIIYGSKTNGGNGATAPSTGGSATWQAKEKSVTGGTLTNIASGSPSINVLSADGAGTMDVAPISATQGSSGNTLVFTYTADPGGLNNGAISLTVPTGWSAPSTTSSDPGYTATTASGTLSVANRVINITGLTMSGGQQFTVTYGAAPGPGATASSTAGPSTWTTKERSSSNGTLANIATQPTVTLGATALDHFKIEAVGGGNIANQQAGVAFSVKITAQDVLNNTVTSFNGTVDISASRTCSSGCTTTAAFTNGVLSSHSITLSQAGTAATVTATQTGGPVTTPSNSFTVYSADGSGTITSNTSFVRNGSTGNTITLTYTAALGGIGSGSITVDVPTGWSAPTTNGSDNGFVKTNVGSISTLGQTITVSGLNRLEGETVQIIYGSKSNGGSGATAPSTGGSVTWQAQEKSVSGGTLTNVASGSPSINVLSADGAGTMTVSPTSAIQSSTGNRLTFTYTADPGGLNNGAISLTVPTTWPAPTTTSSDQGYTTSTAGAMNIANRVINITGLTMTGGQQFTVTYGAAPGPGATAPATAGLTTWTTKERSSSGGTLTSTAAQPTVNVGADALDHFKIEAAAGGNVGNQQRNVPFAIKITAQDASNHTVTTFNGTVDVSSSLTCSSGCTTTAAFTNGVLASHSVTLSQGGTGSTITATKTGGGISTPSNSFTVYSADGDGTVVASPTFVRNGSTGNSITFTYTAAAGGTSSGALTIAVPAGWTPPTTIGLDNGFTKTNVGSVSTVGQTITVSGFTRTEGQTVVVTYGSKSNGGAGATAPVTAGSATWQVQEKSLSAGTLTNVTSGSPSITVLSADGSGAMAPSPSTATASSTGNTITFTYTAAAGGMNNGSVSLVVPTGWSVPTTTSGIAGYTTASGGGGTVSISSRTITVSGVTLSDSQTMTITYGSTSGGSPGATAPSIPGPQIWTAKQRSSSSGTLTLIAPQPIVTIS